MNINTTYDYYQTIKTKILPPTDRLGWRVKASYTQTRANITLPVESGSSFKELHELAARSLVLEYNDDGDSDFELYGGEVSDASEGIFVHVPKKELKVISGGKDDQG